jgi:putative redox protein
MGTVKTKYTGSLSTSTSYALSESPILTKANTFGPTDLLTASLGSCIVTYIDFIAKKNGFSIDEANVEIKKTMNADGTMVTNFDVILNLNSTFSAEQKLVIENAAKSCPVGNSLHIDIKRTYVFNYQY